MRFKWIYENLICPKRDISEMFRIPTRYGQGKKRHSNKINN